MGQTLIVFNDPTLLPDCLYSIGQLHIDPETTENIAVNYLVQG